MATDWHFLVFGLLHGTYLTINHAFRIFRPLPRNCGWRNRSALLESPAYLSVSAGRFGVFSCTFGSIGDASAAGDGRAARHRRADRTGRDAPRLGSLGDAPTSIDLLLVSPAMEFAVSAGHMMWIILLYGII